MLAALGAAWFLGPPAWRAPVTGAVGGLGGRIGRFIESGRSPDRARLGIGGAAAVPPPPRFTDGDRAYLNGVWKHVESTFVANPRVAVDLAHSTASGFFTAHGVEVSGLPEGPDGLEEDTETLRLRLLAIKAWSDREAAH
ncbi:hypothetical protein GCM10009839_70130 [Catenulispora yoronensis]|uniref:Uncharacterized protein n=1 Tax=Catenulispora yoronensis TaxID=450799 RepID=A0ABP5GNX2_9ACTN